MRDELDKVMQRTQRYWFVDGLAEMASGCVLALVTLLFVIDGTAPQGSPLHAVSSIGLAPVILIGGLLAGRIVVAIKSRITYPRTGFVSYRRRAGSRWLTGLVGAFVAAAVSALVFAFQLVQSVIILGQGILVGVLLLYWGITLDLRRYYVVAALSVAFGVAISLTRIDLALGDAVYFGLMALSLIVSGALTLRAYLRDAPPPAQEDQA